MAGQLGHRLRRGAASGAIVAAAVAALAASQAPGNDIPPSTDTTGGEVPIGAGDTTAPPAGSASGDSPYFTALPPLNSPNKPGATVPTTPIVTGPAEAGIPATVLAAYKRAEESIRSTDPGCNLPWQLLAGIGKVESGHANGGRVDTVGTSSPAILGPVLSGGAFANIPDTDGGAYDGDATHDRAVGPMQFIPSTWATWGQDANGDGRKDPNNIYDAAQAAGLYLCAHDRNLAVKADLDQAVLSYNHSREYLNTVLSWAEYYKRGTHQVPDGTGVLPVGRSDGRVRTPVTTTPGTKTPSASKPPVTKPTAPAKPGTTPKPPTEPTEPTTPTPPATDPATAAVTIENATSGPLAATAGSVFTNRPAVRVLDKAGKPVEGARVRFRIGADTDIRFTLGTLREIVLVTGAEGWAATPELRAGEKTGDFGVVADVVGSAAKAVSFKVTVTERQADTLTRVDAKDLSATTGGRFADEVRVKATDGGKAAAKVAVTATFVTSADAGAKPATEGPSFKAADGTAIRTLTGLKTDADGVVTLPEIFAGDKTGTFVLRLTAPGGGTATVELKVTAPDPEQTPGPTPSPTTPSPAPSATKSAAPSAKPTAAATAKPSATASAKPSATPSAAPSPSASATASASPSASPSATSEPKATTGS
ncbi:lytic transglycosylase domain-containing protein [Streptomyces sp. NPDC048718]|uniref:lytic transglycosylase domain-containing protein n=1 Tax=Streptomyces sp. NPDC048718 TaxID=3365587 RepID=UPI0037202981